MNGYRGKILNVDLTLGRSWEEDLNRDVCKKYLGGSGLAAHLLYTRTPREVEAFDPENHLIFMTGPLTGTIAPTSGRHAVVARSPLTGIWGESDVGGSWGKTLKQAGYDGIIVKGASNHPVYLALDCERAEIRDASHLWRRDTIEVDEILKEEIHEQVVTTSIGEAGENRVRFAAIMSDGLHGRAAGRCGLGAVMGSKRLKAIAVKGDADIPVFDRESLKRAVRAVVPGIRERTRSMNEFGTGGGVPGIEHIGDLPIKNWQAGEWKEGAEAISGQRIARDYLSGKYYCRSCVIGCGRKIHMQDDRYGLVEGGGPEYETLACLGSNCLIEDLPALLKANDLCNRFGLDTISAGGVIAFAMEAFEKGFLSEKELGYPLKWGDPDALLQMIQDIVKRRGAGDILAEGVKRAAQRLDPLTREFAIEVKGMEFPGHDPRAYNSLAVGYATSNRGACHLQAFSHQYENRIHPSDLGFQEIQDRFAVKEKGRLTAKAQDLMAIFDSLKLCKFILGGGLKLQDILSWTFAVTGEDFSPEEMMQLGERIFTLKRVINNRYGISRKDDTLPPRILTLKRGGGTEDNLPPLGLMLSDYYAYRGWDEWGFPTKEKLEELGI